MATYPSSLWSGNTRGTNLADAHTHTKWHDDIMGEVIAVQTELGTAPSGSLSTVASRLAGLGEVAAVELLATSTGYSAVADITGMSVTFTAVSGVKYLTTLVLPNLRQQTSTGGVEAQITDSGGTQLQRVFFDADSAQDFSLYTSLRETGLSGSTTRKARLLTSAGTVDVFGSSQIRNLLLVQALNI